jgi:hypothetical protein
MGSGSMIGRNRVGTYVPMSGNWKTKIFFSVRTIAVKIHPLNLNLEHVS